MLGLLRNSVFNVHQYVFNKELYKLDLRKTNIKLTNIICALSLLVASEKASYRERDFSCICVS